MRVCVQHEKNGRKYEKVGGEGGDRFCRKQDVGGDDMELKMVLQIKAPSGILTPNRKHDGTAFETASIAQHT